MAAAAATAAGSVTCLRRGLVGRSSSMSVRPPAMVSFADEGHLRYYASARCGKKEEKKREKLMKGLRKDLIEFSSMRFGADNEGETQGTVTGKVKSKMISIGSQNDGRIPGGPTTDMIIQQRAKHRSSLVFYGQEAADVLLAQLTQLRTDAKEMKMRKKQEKKAATKLAKAKDEDSSSSSSSSESSDGECETAVLRMSSIGTTVPESHREPVVVPKPLAMEVGEKKEKNVMLETNAEAVVKAVENKIENKIEVCMGGKCKKSGATELLAEFDREVGVAGAVVGCKCMGKCRDGPNVRVVNRSSEEEEAKVSRNLLCIGVSLEDVGAVVSSFFGESKDVGFLAV